MRRITDLIMSFSISSAIDWSTVTKCGYGITSPGGVWIMESQTRPHSELLLLARRRRRLLRMEPARAAM